MVTRPRWMKVGAGHLVAGLGFSALVLLLVSISQLLAQGTH